MGFGLVNGFFGQLCTEFVTKSNCSAIANSHSAIHYSIHISIPTLLCLHQFSGNGFQQQTFPFLWVPELFPRPQQPASSGNSSQGLNRSSPPTNSLAHQPTHSTPPTSRLEAIPHHPSTLFIVVAKLSSNGSGPSLYSLSMDPTENTASKGCSVVARESVATITSNGHCLLSHYIATAIVWLLISSSLHNSEPICHNT
jgi:hypothetical protein